MTDDARKQRKAALLEAAKINAGFAAALENPSGRAMLWWILEQAGIFRQPHSANALNTAFACGKKEVGLFLIERLSSVDPAGFVRMQMERIDNVGSSDPGTRDAGTVASEFSESDREPDGWGTTEAG